MRTICEVFEYCKAVHAPNPAAAVRAITPTAKITRLWDRKDFGTAMGVVGATIYDRPAALLCFQGTRGNMNDWWRNFEIWPDNRGVNQGFAREWEQYRIEVGQWAARLDSHIDIYTTGHSQGGPTACQASGYLWEQFCRPSSCITFGSPKWCTKDARNRYDILPINLTNVINPADLVTRVDPKAERPGKEFELRQNWWNWMFPWFWIVEHTIEMYGEGIVRTRKVLDKQ